MSTNRITYFKHGKEVNPALLPKPSLCTRCIKDEQEESNRFCTMNRVDQTGKKHFYCYAYERKDSHKED